MVPYPCLNCCPWCRSGKVNIELASWIWVRCWVWFWIRIWIRVRIRNIVKNLVARATIIWEECCSCDVSNVASLCAATIVENNVEFLYAICHEHIIIYTFDSCLGRHLLARPFAIDSLDCFSAIYPCIKVRSAVGLNVYYDRSIWIYLSVCSRTSVLCTLVVYCTPFNCLGVAKLHIRTDSECSTLAWDFDLVLAFNLIPTACCAFAKSSSNCNSLCAEAATIRIKHYGSVLLGILATIIYISTSLFLSIVTLIVLALSRSCVDEWAILAYYTASPILYKYTYLTLCCRSVYGDSRTSICLTSNNISICAFWAICKCGTTIEGYECVAILVSTLEGDTTIGSTTILGPLTLTECRNCLTNLVQTNEVLSQIMIQCGIHITRSLIFTEVRCVHITSDITTEVSTTRLRERTIRTVVNLGTASETNLRTIVDTWDTTEGKHQREILCPLSISTRETDTITWLRTVVVAIYIYYIISSIIIHFITTFSQTVCACSIAKVVVQWEIDNIESTWLRIVWFMPFAIHHKGVIAFRSFCIIFLTERHQLRIITSTSIKEVLCIPIWLATIKLIHQVLWSLPCIIIRWKIGLITVLYTTVTGTHLTIHKERSLVEALILVLLAKSSKLRDKLLAEGKTRDVTRGIDTETIYTHLDELAIALYEILCHLVVLSVKVYTVACNLSPPTVR